MDTTQGGRQSEFIIYLSHKSDRFEVFVRLGPDNVPMVQLAFPNELIKILDPPDRQVGLIGTSHMGERGTKQRQLPIRLLKGSAQQRHPCGRGMLTQNGRLDCSLKIDR